MLLWKPAAVPVKALSPGMSGEEVLRLRQHLERLAGMTDTGAAGERYDASLVQLVENFQRERRLDVDGIAGWQTQLALDAAAPAADTPVLVASAPGS